MPPFDFQKRNARLSGGSIRAPQGMPDVPAVALPEIEADPFSQEDPRTASIGDRQDRMDVLRARAFAPAGNVFTGIGNLASALAYRSLANEQEQAKADPWSAMREPTPASPLAGIGQLFGL